jgi:2-polyprenyl-3-methyl-5-hydroxy-6-metoxy-1,4-benzoquinol methylase
MTPVKFKMKNKPTTSSLERIYPDGEGKGGIIAGNDTIQLHLERYHYAGKYLAPGIIADIACGGGYGSYLLATVYREKIKKIFAVDNSTEAIEYANYNYPHRGIEFHLADAFSFQSPALFDTIISLETIEHLDEPEKFIQHLSKQLNAGGRFIASAPVTPSMDANPFHKQDFTIATFKRLFEKNGLQELASFVQIQPYQPFKLLGKRKGREAALRKNILRYYFKHPGKFFLRIKSLFKEGFVNKYLVIVFEKK